jgi:ABC-type phosphate/phosphonate transport system substrate-binding protein
MAEDVRRDIIDALLELTPEERELALAVFRSSRFEPCAPAYMDMLRRLRETDG